MHRHACFTFFFFLTQICTRLQVQRQGRIGKLGFEKGQQLYGTVLKVLGTVAALLSFLEPEPQVEMSKSGER